ncbi:MAG TPA: DNA polymerase III subunit beta [Candidatus Paceibacterota bacterium]|nr:DNA polymerase III subunit beta [Candidatus Paceibacterota bacterium]HRZ34229.1 DNA polymerase III subunit beta [Candidatus Paceibacterota bacterium]
MKIEINKERLTRIVSKAEKIATKGSTLPALSCLMFDFDGTDLTINSTNLDISLKIVSKVKGSGTGKVLVPAAILNSFLTNLPKRDSVIKLEANNSKLHVTSESTDTIINTQSVDDFPVISDKKSDKLFKISSSDLVKGLNSVWYSTATSSIKPELSSVYVYHDDGDLVFVGTDSFRLAESRILVKNVDTFENILIPYKNTVEMVRLLEDLDEEIEVCFEQDKIIVETHEMTIISRVIDGVFPDYRQIIPKEVKTEVHVLKDDLQQCLKVSSVFADKFNQVTFTISPKDEIFQIESNSSEVGETKNNIKCQINGDSLKLSFNSRYINDCFNSIKSDGLTLKFSGAEKPMIIQGTSDKSFLYLVMPMNR